MGPRAGLDGRKISSPPGFDPVPSSNTLPTKVISKRILDELLGIREESVIPYLWGMKQLAYLSYFSTLKLVDYVLVYCTKASRSAKT